jgi:hypothetical protein
VRHTVSAVPKPVVHVPGDREEGEKTIVPTVRAPMQAPVAILTWSSLAPLIRPLATAVLKRSSLGMVSSTSSAVVKKIGSAGVAAQIIARKNTGTGTVRQFCGCLAVLLPRGNYSATSSTYTFRDSLARLARATTDRARVETRR